MKRSKIQACAIQRVWPYPLAPDEMKPGGPQHHWAWGCRCGKGGHGHETEEACRAEAAAHFDGAQPAASAWPQRRADAS